MTKRKQYVTYEFSVKGQWIEDIIKRANAEAQRLLGPDFEMNDVLIKPASGGGRVANCQASAEIEWRGL